MKGIKTTEEIIFHLETIHEDYKDVFREREWIPLKEHQESVKELKKEICLGEGCKEEYCTNKDGTPFFCENCETIDKHLKVEDKGGEK